MAETCGIDGIYALGKEWFFSDRLHQIRGPYQSQADAIEAMENAKPNTVTCTRQHPWKPGQGKTVHPYAIWIRDEYDSSCLRGYYEVWECPICGIIFHFTVQN